jgi:diguanylate cyclase (GGDEF)-like protein
VTGLALWLFGLVVGAVLGWLAARHRYWGPVERGRPAAPADDPPAARFPAPIRAMDAASGLPPDAKLDVLARMLAERASERTAMPCAVALRDTDAGPITIIAHSSDVDPRLLGIQVDPDSSAGRAVTDGIPMVAPADEPVLRGETRDRRRPQRGGLAVPIRSASRVEGALLAIGAAPGEAPQMLLAHMEQLVRRFAPVLVPAHQVSIAERKAATDEVTGLANRRALRRAMENAEAGRSAMLMVDLDHFKRVNDALGHVAGDAALRHVAQLIRAGLRPGDEAARVGGEEFAIWLPGADLAEGMEIAERLRELVRSSPFRHSGRELSLTISCGVSAYPVPVGHPDNLLATADSALYRAKRAGRDRVMAIASKDS